MVSVNSLSRPRGPSCKFRLLNARLSGTTTGTKLGDEVSGAKVFSRQHPPPQHWLMSFVAVSVSPSILLISAGLSEISVVEARRGRGVSCSVKDTEAAGRSLSASTTSSSWNSVLGVGGASESLLWPLHSMDSLEDRGDVWSGCDWVCNWAGWRVTWGTSRGSEGIGSSG